MNVEQENREACRKFQAYYQEALCNHTGTQAPAPIEGQSVNSYRAECCLKFKRTYLPPDHPLARVNYRRLVANDSMNEFGTLERQLLPACRVGAENPMTVPAGEIRAIPKRDPMTGAVLETKYVGQESFVKQFTTPGRRVASFRTHQGAVDASGMFLR